MNASNAYCVANATQSALVRHLHNSVELGQFVEEQDGLMGERDLAYGLIVHGIGSQPNPRRQLSLFRNRVLPLRN